jgi:opacity protein-like surface antigen
VFNQIPKQMKKIIATGCMFALLLTLISVAVQAQTLVFKVNPVAPLVTKTAVVQLEGAIADKASLQFGLMYRFPTTVGSVSTGQQKYDDLGVSAELRFYPSEVLHGIYLGPVGLYNSRVYKYEKQNGTTASGKTNISMYGGGAMVGYQFLFNNNIAIDLGAGGAYMGVSREDIDVTENGTTHTVPAEDLKKGFKFLWTASVGYAF